MNPRKRDRICPHCGFPLPLDRPSRQCPECGYDFVTGTAPQPRPHLTVFGHGVCGMVAGTFVGAAWALTMPPNWREPLMVLLPLALGGAAALVAWFIGRHIAIEHYRGYEILLLSADVGAMVAAGAALFDVLAGGVLFGIGLGAALIARSLLLRLPHLDSVPDN
jgi:uncharacterized protein (DUF983 family)